MTTHTVEQSQSIHVESEFGTFRLSAVRGVLTQLFLPTQFSLESQSTNRGTLSALLEEAAEQLQAFFAGTLRQFDVPLDATSGTEFQRRVWHELRCLPFGSTTSYSQLAARIGRPEAARAVGAANARNPIPIIVPCHRVVGSDGSLTGYAGGTQLKQRLIEHETKALCSTT